MSELSNTYRLIYCGTTHARTVEQANFLAGLVKDYAKIEIEINPIKRLLALELVLEEARKIWNEMIQSATMAVSTILEWPSLPRRKRNDLAKMPDL